jgi:CRISPR/Cas system CMR subunit Cmr6 (Cas7 group RAMP superfamily)
VFGFRLRKWAEEEGGEKGLEWQAREVELEDAVRCWLRQGLTEIGAGGKTAAGYGYFDVPAVAREEPRKEAP